MSQKQETKKRKNKKSIKDVYLEAANDVNQIKMIMKSTKPLPKSYNAICFLKNGTLLAIGNCRGVEIIHFKTMKTLRNINYKVIPQIFQPQQQNTNADQQNQVVNNMANHNNVAAQLEQELNFFEDYFQDFLQTSDYVSIALIKQLNTNSNWIGVSDYKRIKVWDYIIGQEIFEFHNSGTISVFAESQKHKVLLIGNSKGQLQIGSLVDGRLNHLYPKSSVLQIVITQNENYAVVCLSKDNKIIIYDLEKVLLKNSKEGMEISQFAQIYTSTLLGDNKIAMIDSFSNLIVIENENFQQKSSLNMRNLFKQFMDDKRSIDMVYLNDNQHIAIFYKKSILIYNYNTKQIVADHIKNHTIKNFKTYAWNNIAFSPKHKQLVIWAKSQQKGYLYTIDLLNYQKSQQIPNSEIIIFIRQQQQQEQ